MPELNFKMRVLKYGNVYDIMKGKKKLATYYPRTDRLAVFKIGVNGVYDLIGIEEWVKQFKEGWCECA